jgi:hypothetical protein
MAQPEPLATEQQNKRKRDSDDNGQQSHDRIPQPPPPQSGSGAHINYLTRSNPTRLRLIQGDGEMFADVLGLIGDYEGVLSRHESLAANLGAKLTGPRLVKAMEGLFEGTITTTRRDPYNSDTVTWLDIVQFAKASPNEFTLVTNPDRGRCCSFYLKGNQVEITEDDWRLIMSGTLDRFNLAPPQPLEEDESSELATLEIMEQRLQVLIKKADEVARKARQLNYHLSGRKAAINSRRTARSPTTHHAGFQPVNHPQSVPRSISTYDLHADLLQQFTSQSQPGSARIPSQNSISLPTTPVIQVSNHAAPCTPFFACEGGGGCGKQPKSHAVPSCVIHIHRTYQFMIDSPEDSLFAVSPAGKASPTDPGFKDMSSRKGRFRRTLSRGWLICKVLSCGLKYHELWWSYLTTMFCCRPAFLPTHLLVSYNFLPNGQSAQRPTEKLAIAKK